MSSSSRIGLIVLLWVAALAGAFALDRPVAERVRERGLDAKSKWTRSHAVITQTLKVPGEYWFTLVVAAAAGFAHRRRLYATALVASAGAISGINGLVKWFAGRRRPVKGIHPFEFDPFPGGLRGLFKQDNLCFPSGHTCLAFAVAAAMGMLFPRWKWTFYAIAAVVGMERVMENAHYVSDCVAAALLGILSAYAARWLLRKWRWKAEPIHAAQTVLAD